MLVSISIVAHICGVCPKNLRRWEAAKKMIPKRTLGNHRRYSKSALLEFLHTGIYALHNRTTTKIDRINITLKTIDTQVGRLQAAFTTKSTNLYYPTSFNIIPHHSILSRIIQYYPVFSVYLYWIKSQIGRYPIS